MARAAEMYERGAVGEEQTAEVLKGLPVEEWTAFHDLRWPGRRYANVDHVVVGPPGVFVIDSKNWSGRIEVRNQVLRQNGRMRETAVAGVAEAGIAIAELSHAVGPHHVHPVLCFVRDEPVSGWARDVMVCSTSTLLTMLTTRPSVLSAEQRGLLVLELDAALRSATAQDLPSITPRVIRGAPRLRGRRAAPRAASHPRRARRTDRVRLLVGLALLALLLFAPATITVLAIGVGSWFVSSVAEAQHESAATNGACPGARPVKGFTAKDGVRVYLAPDAKRYDNVSAERCFDSEATASAAGFVTR